MSNGQVRVPLFVFNIALVLTLMGCVSMDEYRKTRTEPWHPAVAEIADLPGTPAVAPIKLESATAVDYSITPVKHSQLQCMARNIYFEAGGEPVAGKAAVARVVMNRVDYGFAKTPCEVVYQKTTLGKNRICQFSWVCENKRSPDPTDPAYLESKQVAYDVMIHGKYKHVVPTTTLFFRSVKLHGYWPHRVVARIGGHVFYEKRSA